MEDLKGGEVGGGPEIDQFSLEKALQHIDS